MSVLTDVALPQVVLAHLDQVLNLARAHGVVRFWVLDPAQWQPEWANGNGLGFVADFRDDVRDDILVQFALEHALEYLLERVVSVLDRSALEEGGRWASWREDATTLYDAAVNG